MASQQRRDELAIQLLAMTRADRTAGRVSKAGGNHSGVYASASANTFS
jgi:hypothetical protein